MVISAVPDVCKTPSYPVPYTNIAFSRDLAKGMTSVKSHDGAMNGIKGCEFSISMGDNPGVGGGVKSGVNMDKATFLIWSPNVPMEGKPVTRQTDKMLMNKGNTISAGGYFTGTPADEANRRFPGLHCSLCLSFVAESAIRRPKVDCFFTTNWLTLLADDIVEGLGGAAALTEAVTDNCPTHTYDGGLILQAGPYPQPGDNNRGITLRNYQRVAKATKAARFADYEVGLFAVK